MVFGYFRIVDYLRGSLGMCRKMRFKKNSTFPAKWASPATFVGPAFLGSPRLCLSFGRAASSVSKIYYFLIEKKDNTWHTM